MKKLNKIELIKECQRLMLMNDYSVMSAKVIGDFMKENLETGEEYYHKHKDEFDKIHKEALDNYRDYKNSLILCNKCEKEQEDGKVIDPMYYVIAEGKSVGAVSPKCEFFKTGDLIGYLSNEKNPKIWKTKESTLLLCDGRKVSIKKYKKLFETIKYSFGGKGMYFKLPRLFGKEKEQEGK